VGGAVAVRVEPGRDRVLPPHVLLGDHTHPRVVGEGRHELLLGRAVAGGNVGRTAHHQVRHGRPRGARTHRIHQVGGKIVS
jgi:hypothetical protein